MLDSMRVQLYNFERLRRRVAPIIIYYFKLSLISFNKDEVLTSK